MGLIVVEATGGCPQTAHSGARACSAKCWGIWYCVRIRTESERIAAVTHCSNDSDILERWSDMPCGMAGS